ncbi:response regulator [Paenibacillus sp. MBLB4367]|uniref:response regulator n=1 Tax=Paenibacillus sp. MBLB4367 TaxID=3384767 RepID=UPI0039080D1A
MNLMIVEDELRLRTSLAEKIPWERNGIEVVGLAANGVEALQLIELKRPDLILLDIQMPHMDGLTFVRKVREQDPDMKCVILSGHDNFAYAQTAMELGVSKYLLKPAGDTDILQAVTEAAEQLRMELERRHSQSELQVKWKEHLPHLQDMFLQSWIAGNYASWEIELRSRELHIELPAEAMYAVALFDMDPLGEGEERFLPEDEPLLRFSLNSIARECFASQLCWICADAEGKTAVIFALADALSENEALLQVQAAATKLLNVFKQCLKVTASAGISGSTRMREDVSKLYRQAGKALQARLVHGSDLAIPYREEYGTGSGSAPSLDREKELEIGFETGDENKVSTALGELWIHGVENAHSADAVREHLYYVSGLLGRMIQRQGWSLQQVAGDDAAYFHNLHALAEKEQAYAWLQRIVARMVESRQSERKSAVHKTIRQILEIVDQDMDKEITLFTVADRLYVNSSYLSRLFKQEMGKPFTNYVQERKMERAKQLLLGGSKVYDAASMVGYKDVSHFTRVFRKYWGVTPGEMKP